MEGAADRLWKVIGVRTLNPDRDYVLEITTEGGNLTEGAPNDIVASLSLPAEAFVRLTLGRLDSEHTPVDVEIAQAASLNDLRRVFPGY